MDNTSWLELMEDIDTNELKSLEKSKKNIDDIMVQNYDTLKRRSIVELLLYQTILCEYIKINIKKKSLDDTINKITMLQSISKILCDKNNLKIIKHKPLDFYNGSIPRSSYNFCDNNYKCEYYYKKIKKSGCNQQHYVHNLIFVDIESLKLFIIKYGNDMQENLKIFNEITTSLNTISFVIDHMFQEHKIAYS
jgi:hypothetical protein